MSKTINLTEFQKKVVMCKPEINKPVFILTGAGVGKTVALKERAKFVDFLYYSHFTYNSDPVFNSGNMCDSYNEIVFEVYPTRYVAKILELSKTKKVIVLTNPIDFVEYFANSMKGEYTIISGYNVYDNDFIGEDYIDYLRSLKREDGMKLYHGTWK